MGSSLKTSKAMPASPGSVVLLMGPTAAGKTAAAVRLFKAFPVEILSVDSAMVYRGMDIGTGKPSPAVLEEAPHRLIDVRDPHEPYSAADFAADAGAEIRRILQAGRIPLLVGGSGLYFRALRKGLAALPAADAAVRRQIDGVAAREGWAFVHRQLAEVDPESARRIHPKDPQRIQRALEVYQLTGRSMSSWLKETQTGGLDPGLHFTTIILEPHDRSRLHEAIAARFQDMLAQGFEEEVVELRHRYPLHADLPAMRAVGYRQMYRYLEGHVDYEGMRLDAIVATRRLARRQLTWLRQEKHAERFDCHGPLLYEKLCRLLDGRLPGELLSS